MQNPCPFEECGEKVAHGHGGEAVYTPVVKDVYTAHGHTIPGMTYTEGGERPRMVARCGGPGLCKECSVEASSYQQQQPNLRQREGDQALPQGDASQESCQKLYMDRISKEMPERIKLGIARYGQPLMPFNGRDFMRDAFDELLDLAVYMEGLATERQAMIELLGRLRTAATYGNPDLVQLQKDATDLLKRMGAS